MKLFLILLLFSFSVSAQKVDSVKLKTADYNQGIYPEWWGALGDFKHDDTWALNECYKFVLTLKGYSNLTVVWSKLYMTTAPINIGYPFVDGEGWFNMIGPTSKGFDMTTFLLTRYRPLVSTIGKGRAGIYANFNDTLKIQPAILFNLQGSRAFKETIELFNVSFKDIGVYAKGYFDLDPKGEKFRTGYPNNNVAGIVALYNTGLTIEGCTIAGFKEGIVQNYSYFSRIENNAIISCKRGLYSYGSASSSTHNNRYSFCKLGAEIRSSAYKIDTDYFSSCNQSLIIGAGGVMAINMYIESSVTDSAQIIIGDSPGEPFFPSRISDYVDQTILIAPIIVANKVDHSPGISILMKQSAVKLLIMGGSISSSNKVGLSPLNVIEYWGTTGNWSKPLCKKIIAQ